jgi:SAM-dependent methyltransferase
MFTLGSVEDVPQNPAGEWSEYFSATLGKPLHPLFATHEARLPRRGRALELGCGVGTGVLYLVDRGLEVDAVDIHPEAIQIVRQRLGQRSGVRLFESSFVDLELPSDHYDLVAAGFSLFFLSPDEFSGFWQRVLVSMRTGGSFLGQFLGLEDDWADRGYSVQTREEVSGLLRDFRDVDIDEVNREGLTSVGTAKHWHVFHVFAEGLRETRS